MNIQGFAKLVALAAVVVNCSGPVVRHDDRSPLCLRLSHDIDEIYRSMAANFSLLEREPSEIAGHSQAYYLETVAVADLSRPRTSAIEFNTNLEINLMKYGAL